MGWYEESKLLPSDGVANDIFGRAVEVNGDLVIARATELTKAQMEAYLFIIGRLIGFARQLDVLLKDDRDIGFYVEKFMSQLKETNENPNSESGG